MDSGQTSQAFVDPPKTPVWYLEHATQLHREAEQQLVSESDPSKVIIFLRQCKYLVKHLGTAIDSSRKSLNRSLSPEHKAECRGALELLCRLAKEVGTFVWECCNESWMQAALTPASVPKHVSSWRWHLKVCTELLCHSNKLGATWLSIAQAGSLGQAEHRTIIDMASDDERDLRRLLKSMLDQSNESNSNILIQNVELLNIVLMRLKARHAASTVRSRDLLSLKNTYLMWSLRVDSKALFGKKAISVGDSGIVFEGNLFGAIKVAIKDMSNKPLKATINEVPRPSHPNIVSSFGFDLENSHMYRLFQVLEFMDEDLYTMMERRMQEDGNREGPFSIWEACDIMLQVAEGVRYMHQNRVFHGDLRSQKVFVRSLKDETLEYICAKVSSSGIVRSNEKNITDAMQLQNLETRRWMALYAKAGKISNMYDDMVQDPFKSDVFCFGLTCFEILTGDSPFLSINPQGVKEKVFTGVCPSLPEKTPQSLKNLIKSCWIPEPIIRPSFAKICKELRYIRFSLLLEPQDHTTQLPLPVVEPLHLPPHVSKFKGEYASLKVVRKLGSGGSDMVTVFLSTWLQPENEVAQKRFMGSHNECFKNEVAIMTELEHPNVVRLLHYASDRRSCSIVMKLMDGDLHDLMLQRRLEGKVTLTGPFSMADAVHVILHIARGMAFIHEKYVVHRDLKSCNILIKKASGGGKLEVKVADFGLSMKLASCETRLRREKVGVGTIRWMAPEVTSVPNPFRADTYSFEEDPTFNEEDLDTGRKDVDTRRKDVDTGRKNVDTGKKNVDTGRKNVDTGRKNVDTGKKNVDTGRKNVDTERKNVMYDPFKSDVFSFGMLCYEILVGRVPYFKEKDLDTVRKNVLNGQRPVFPEWTPSYLKVLLENCLAEEASVRPTFTGIVGELTQGAETSILSNKLQDTLD